MTWLFTLFLACQTPTPTTEVVDAAALEEQTGPAFAMQVIVLNYDGLKYMGTGVPPERTKTEAHELAVEIIAEAKANSDNFDEMVYTYSDAPASESAGRTESFPLDEDQGPFEYLKDLPVGAIGDDPVSMPYGIVIAKRIPPVPRILIAGRHLVVPFEGAIRAPADITTSKPGAKSRATQLRAQVADNPQGFEALIQAESTGWDADHGGYLGTWWTETNRYSPIYETALTGLKIGEISKPVRTEYGYELFQRVTPVPQDVQLAGSHILISHSDATASKNPRSKAEALTLATSLVGQIDSIHAFQEAARASSDDGTKSNAGDLGAWKLYSKLPKTLDDAFLSLKFGDIAGPVETEYGYHVILRRESPQDRTLRYRKPTIRQKPGSEPDQFQPNKDEDKGHDDHAGHNH